MNDLPYPRPIFMFSNAELGREWERRGLKLLARVQPIAVEVKYPEEAYHYAKERTIEAMQEEATRSLARHLVKARAVAFELRDFREDRTIRMRAQMLSIPEAYGMEDLKQRDYALADPLDFQDVKKHGPAVMDVWRMKGWL